MSWNSIFFSLLFHPPLRCCWRLFHGIFIFPARQSSRAAIFIAHFYTSAIALVSVAQHICWREASLSTRWRREVWANFYCSILLRFFFSPSHIYLYFFSIQCAVCSTTTLCTMEMKKHNIHRCLLFVAESCAEATDASRTPSTALTKRSMKPNRSE